MLNNRIDRCHGAAAIVAGTETSRAVCGNMGEIHPRVMNYAVTVHDAENAKQVQAGEECAE